MCIDDVHIADWENNVNAFESCPSPTTLETVQGFSVKLSRGQITEKPDYL